MTHHGTSSAHPECLLVLPGPSRHCYLPVFGWCALWSTFIEFYCSESYKKQLYEIPYCIFSASLWFEYLIYYITHYSHWKNFFCVWNVSYLWNCIKSLWTFLKNSKVLTCVPITQIKKQVISFHSLKILPFLSLLPSLTGNVILNFGLIISLPFFFI